MKSTPRHADSGPPLDREPAQDFPWEKAQRAKFPNLKSSTETISLRMPISMLAEIKLQANRRDVPYQSYIKMLLSEAIGRHAAP